MCRMCQYVHFLHLLVIDMLVVGLRKFMNLTVITYNSVGQLWCTVCNVPVKTNLLWNSHVQGRTHREVLYLQLSVITHREVLYLQLSVNTLLLALQ